MNPTTSHDKKPRSIFYPARDAQEFIPGGKSEVFLKATPTENSPHHYGPGVGGAWGPAEVGHHAVAEVLRDASAEALDGLRRRAMVLPDDFAPLLGDRDGWRSRSSRLAATVRDPRGCAEIYALGPADGAGPCGAGTFAGKVSFSQA